MSYTIDPTRDGYKWTVTLDGNTAEGEAPNETTAMREVARALHWLTAGNPPEPEPEPEKAEKPRKAPRADG